MLEESRVQILDDMALCFSRDKPSLGHEWREAMLARLKDNFVYCCRCSLGGELGKHRCKLVGSQDVVVADEDESQEEEEDDEDFAIISDGDDSSCTFGSEYL